MLQSSLFFCIRFFVFLIIPLYSAISYFTLNFITFYLFLPFLAFQSSSYLPIRSIIFSFILSHSFLLFHFLLRSLLHSISSFSGFSFFIILFPFSQTAFPFSSAAVSFFCFVLYLILFCPFQSSFFLSMCSVLFFYNIFSLYSADS